MHQFDGGSLCLGRGYETVVLPRLRNNALPILSSFYLAVRAGGGRAEVCLRRNFLDPVDFGLRWIHLDSVGVHGMWSIYMIFSMSSSQGR